MIVETVFMGLLASVVAASTAVTQKNIIETSTAAGNFKTLATALTEAGLIDTLNGAGPFTVFAPTDEAFARVPNEKLEALLKDKVALKKVLLYHVVAGNVTAEQVMKLHEAKTVEGSNVAVKVEAGKVHIGEATVTTADVKCSNGVIHIIDNVLMPK